MDELRRRPAIEILTNTMNDTNATKELGLGRWATKRTAELNERNAKIESEALCMQQTIYILLIYPESSAPRDCCLSRWKSTRDGRGGPKSLSLGGRRSRGSGGEVGWDPILWGEIPWWGHPTLMWPT